MKLTIWSRGSRGFSVKGGYHPHTMSGYGSLWEVTFSNDIPVRETCIVSNMKFHELEGKALKDTIWYYKNVEGIDIQAELDDPEYLKGW